MNHNNRVVLILVSVISAVLLSGCFQSMSTDADPTPVSELFATPTPLPPSPTPQPTGGVIERVITATPGPTDTPSITVEPSPTSETVAFVTAEPTEFDALAADAQSEQEQVEPTPTISEALQEATRIIAEATQRSIDATETARGPLTVPTIAPTDPLIQPTPTAPSPGPGTGTGTGTCNYTIRVGDNLFRLSLLYDVPVMTIVQANNNITNPQLIVVGDEIVIPGCNTAGGSFTQSGTGTDGTTTTPVNCNSAISHTVAQGETLFEISMQYNVSVADIARCNNIPDPNFVLMTTVLTIPQ